MVVGRALIVPKHGDSQVLRIEAVEVPDPAPDQVQVRVLASGVNFVEVYQREGIYPVPTPFTLGTEGAGTVLAVGSGAAEFAVGDLVAWATAPGSHADVVNVPAANAVPVPDGLDPELAAAVMLQGMTAHFLVASTYRVEPGSSALVHAAAGGVGQLLTQLIKARGGTVVATVSTPAKADIARRRGADAVLRYADHATADDLAAAIRAANQGRGVDVVYDGVGRDTFDASLASLRPRGLLALFGASSGQVAPFEIQRLNHAGSLFLTRPTMRDYVQNRDDLLWRSGEILDAVREGTLQVDVGARYPLEAAPQAYQALEGRQTTGKVLLTR